MTEQEWLSCTDPQSMVDLLRDKASNRKWRLCAAAWARSIVRHAQTSPTPRMKQYSSWLTPSRWSAQLEAAERFANREIDAKALRAARQDSGGPYNIFLRACSASSFAIDGVLFSLRLIQQEFGVPPDREVSALLRDIFGPFPFRRFPVDPTWLSLNNSTVPMLARSIYEDQAFDRMPILADALEEAGCVNEAILTHCSQPGEHVRGCWALDLVLGKE